MPIHHCQSLLLLLLLAALSGATVSLSLSPQTSPSPPQSPPSPPDSPSPPSPWRPPVLLRRRSPQSSRRRSPRPRGRPSPSPPPAPAPAPEAPAEATEEQMNNIIDALIGSGDFGNWADLISGAVVPLSATLFVPEDDSVPDAGAGRLPGAAGDPFMLPYHVVPQRLTFPELLLFKTGDRLPTLLPEKSIVITNSSRLNFTIDGSPITLPDLYASAAFTVHGVGAVFDYSVYGGGGDAEQLGTLPNPRPDESQVERSPPAQIPADGGFSGLSSDAAPPCRCVELPVFLLAVCVVLGFKMQRNSFRSKP